MWQVTATGLLDYLQAHVNSSLTPEQRMKFLGEPEAEAWTNYIENERRLGREPQLQRTE